MTARAFWMLPLMSGPNEAWNVLNFLFLAIIYTGWKAKAGERFLGFEFYVILLIVAMPTWSAIMSHSQFDQPIIYGLLTQRTNILGAGALAMIMFYRAGWIDTADIREALIIIAWGTLFVFSLYGLATYSNQVQMTGPQIHLNVSFIIIGFLYYGLIGFNKKSKLHYFLASPFLVYLILHGERTMLLTAVGAYGLFILIRGSFSRLVVFLPSALVGAVALVGVLFAVNPSYMTDLGGRIIDAFTVVTTGQTTQDVSANARIVETAVSIPYIEHAPLLGNGDISNQWDGGYAGVLHTYFFPSDVGIFGVVYMYGILGLALFAWQFWYARKYAKVVSRGRATPPMIDAVMAFLIAFAVQSTTTGGFAFNWPTLSIIIAYLYCASEEQRGRKGPYRTRRRYSYADVKGLQNPE